MPEGINSSQDHIRPLTKKFLNMSNLLQIISEPNEILRKKSIEINSNEISNYKTLFEDMIFTMKKSDGIGLAAPQIAKNIRVIIINTKNGPQTMINPVITSKSILKEWDEEGCLSVPMTFGKVKRHKKIICTFLDPDTSQKQIEAKGLMARVIQHEIDHLDGILFTDTAKNIKKLKNQD